MQATLLRAMVASSYAQNLLLFAFICADEEWGTELDTER